MYIFILLFSLAGFSASTKTQLDACLNQAKDCGSIESEHPEALKAYTKGCDSKDFYACYRLGQFQQFTKKNLIEAVKSYEIACQGKDEFGCEGTYDLHMELCYNQDKKEFCGKKDPKDEFRIHAFLQNFDPKFKDAFYKHNFSYSIQNKKTADLYGKYARAKNKKLLAALIDTKKNSYHDGADAEGLSASISEIE